MNELISIIIPVYNIEKYLKNCLDSVCNQTYTSLQIILVDDGSTDSSGDICDQYARHDNRILVIHKENGGLSDARNAGMRVVEGAYIGFVDGDDWIEPDMYENMLEFCKKYDLDVIAARFIEERIDDVSKDQYSGVFEVFSGIQMLEINLYGKGNRLVSNAVWDRLYKRELLQGLLFPKGKCYEDICFTTEVFLRADKCGYWDRGIYHYRIREDSIMGMGGRNKTFFNPNMITDYLVLMKQKADLLYAAGYTDLGDESLFQYLYQVLRCMENVSGKREYREHYRSLLQIYHSNKKWMLCYAGKIRNRRRKIILYTSTFSVWLYIRISRMKSILINMLGINRLWCYNR